MFRHAAAVASSGNHKYNKKLPTHSIETNDKSKATRAG